MENAKVGLQLLILDAFFNVPNANKLLIFGALLIFHFFFALSIPFVCIFLRLRLLSLRTLLAQRSVGSVRRRRGDGAKTWSAPAAPSAAAGRKWRWRRSVSASKHSSRDNLQWRKHKSRESPISRRKSTKIIHSENELIFQFHSALLLWKGGFIRVILSYMYSYRSFFRLAHNFADTVRMSLCTTLSIISSS